MPRRRLAAVFAHPDDDTWIVGGTYLLAGDHLDLTVVVATSGEAGVISDASVATPETLATVREGEERAALAAAGQARANVHFLRYPDGGLAGVDHDELVGRIADVFRSARPEVVVSFGPDGGTGHDDHIAVSRAATDAFHLVRGELDGTDPTAFRRLLYGAVPQSDVDRWFEGMRARGEEVDPDAPFMPRGVPDDAIAILVDTSGVSDAKYGVLCNHETQVDDFQALVDDERNRMLAKETFVLAWPERLDGVPRRPASSVFDGL